MSLPFSLEQLGRIRDDIRRLAARAADHQHELEAVVRAAETDVRQAEAAPSHALPRLRRTSWSDCWTASKPLGSSKRRKPLVTRA
jgi:hypothetical protein